MTRTALRIGAFGLIFSAAGVWAQPIDRSAAIPSAVTGLTQPVGMTLAEFIRRHEKKVMASDTDGDGKVSRAEFLAGASAGKSDPAKRFGKLDRDGDAMLEKAEIDAMLSKRFARRDANGDGVVSAAERASARSKGVKAAGDESQS